MLSLSWWFQLIPIVDSLTLRILFIAGIVLLILGGIMRIVSRKRFEDKFSREIAFRIASVPVVMGLLLVLYWFLAFEQIPLLSARFWMVLWVVFTIFWAWRIFRYAKRTVSSEKARINQMASQRKYFTE